MKRKLNIEIDSKLDLDILRDSLQNQLSTKDLADFAYSLGWSLTEDSKFYDLLKKLNKY